VVPRQLGDALEAPAGRRGRPCAPRRGPAPAPGPPRPARAGTITTAGVVGRVMPVAGSLSSAWASCPVLVGASGPAPTALRPQMSLGGLACLLKGRRWVAALPARGWSPPNPPVGGFPPFRPPRGKRGVGPGLASRSSPRWRCQCQCPWVLPRPPPPHRQVLARGAGLPAATTAALPRDQGRRRHGPGRGRMPRSPVGRHEAAAGRSRAVARRAGQRPFRQVLARGAGSPNGPPNACPPAVMRSPLFMYGLLHNGQKPGENASFHRPDHGILVISRGALGPAKQSGPRGVTSTPRTVVATFLRGRNRWQCYQNVRLFARVGVH